MIKKPEKLCKQEVTGMLVLNGFSVLQTGANLAHEMMHTWLEHEGSIQLNRKLEEGICEVMCHKWIDWYGYKADKSFSYTSEQVQLLEDKKRSIKIDIEERRDNIFGDGFRDAKCAVDRFGLEYTLNFIVKNGMLPDYKKPA